MKTPIFEQSLTLVGSKFDRPTYKQFKYLLQYVLLFVWSPSQVL